MPDSNTTLQAQIVEIDSLPPFPLLGNILKSFLHTDNDGDIRPLISNIESEPSVTAKVLGIANSAYYGGSDEIKTVHDATARIGLLQLKSIIFSLILSSKFKTKQCPHFNVSKFWHDSLLLAYCAQHICNTLKIGKELDKHEIYSIGLLRHLGILALVYLYPERIDLLLSQNSDESLSNLLLKTFGEHHFHISAALLKHWSLPPSFYVPIHHLADEEYNGDYQLIVWVLQQASEIVHKMDQIGSIIINPNLGYDFTQDKLCKILNQTEKDASWITSFAAHLK